MMMIRYATAPNVRIIGKPNAGQLSCFNEGFARAMGEIIFFLDADDIYEPNYVARAIEVFRADPQCDFLACGRRMFGHVEDVHLAFPEDRDLGYSKVVTALRRWWVGGSTSVLAIRRRILQKLLPLPLTDEWRIRADDCLVFGSSLAGARKRYLAEPLVRYRVHDRNHFYHRRRDYTAAYHHAMALNSLFEYCERKYCYDSSRLAEFAHSEFRTIERPTIRQLLQYAQICAGAQIPLTRKVVAVAAMWSHFRRPGRPQTLANASAPLAHWNEIDTERVETIDFAKALADRQETHQLRRAA
jgi:glycosyltransferase involved in cell wall biosynthesis